MTTRRVSLLPWLKKSKTSKDLRPGVSTSTRKWFNYSCATLNYDPTHQRLRYLQMYKCYCTSRHYIWVQAWAYKGAEGSRRFDSLHFQTVGRWKVARLQLPSRGKWLWCEFHRTATAPKFSRQRKKNSCICWGSNAVPIPLSMTLYRHYDFINAHFNIILHTSSCM